jgi:hydrogenase-4 component B
LTHDESSTTLLCRKTTLLIGLLLLFGFGAKLGMLPFYEWFPAAYGSGSGATGVIFSGVVLNAAFYALSRGVLEWLPHSGGWAMSVAIIMIAVGVLSAILTIFMAFQEEDWRRLLSLSSAENAGVAVGVLGASLLLAVIGLPGPAALAWIVCLLHLAGHSLAKGTLFLTADGVYTVNQSYVIRQTGLAISTKADMITGNSASGAAAKPISAAAINVPWSRARKN